MTTFAINREASVYWNQIKDTSEQVKLALISMLSASLVQPKEEKKTTAADQKLRISRKDLEITPFVATIGQAIKPLPIDFDYDKAKKDYLIEKYG